MNKLAYTIGVKWACDALGMKTAANPMMVAAQRKPTWGLQGPTPGGFQQGQRTAEPGGPAPLRSAPVAQQPTQPSQSVPSPTPQPKPVVPAGGPNQASGITQPAPSNEITAPLGRQNVPSQPKSLPGTKLDGKGDVGSVIGATGGSPF
jgi:hypothetical protein